MFTHFLILNPKDQIDWQIPNKKQVKGRIPAAASLVMQLLVCTTLST